MKLKLKNIFLLLLLALFSLAPSLKAYAFNEPYTTAKLAVEPTSSSEKDDGAEDSEVFGFIKDNKNVKDFFYDGSALLYGGILLILISIFGIFKTLKPKKKKRKRRAKRSPSNEEIINNRR